MIDDDRCGAARTRNTVLIITAVAWGILAFESHSGLMTHCMTVNFGTLSVAVFTRHLFTMNSSPTLLTEWFVMLGAMMSPALIQPVRHLQVHSFTRRRARSIAVFVIGYIVIWMAVGSSLLGSQLLVEVTAPQSWLPAMAALVAAVAWQCAPIKQICLNRCHAHFDVPVFGLAADWGALRFGMIHGLWCAGSCWAVMLACMLLPRCHLFAMALATTIIGFERLERPQPPSWRLRGLGKLFRLVRTRARSLWICRGRQWS